MGAAKDLFASESAQVAPQTSEPENSTPGTDAIKKNLDRNLALAKAVEEERVKNGEPAGLAPFIELLVFPSYRLKTSLSHGTVFTSEKIPDTTIPVSQKELFALDRLDHDRIFELAYSWNKDKDICYLTNPYEELNPQEGKITSIFRRIVWDSSIIVDSRFVNEEGKSGFNWNELPLGERRLPRSAIYISPGEDEHHGRLFFVAQTVEEIQKILWEAQHKMQQEKTAIDVKAILDVLNPGGINSNLSEADNASANNPVPDIFHS